MVGRPFLALALALRAERLFTCLCIVDMCGASTFGFGSVGTVMAW
jgi:hypothetical protein